MDKNGNIWNLAVVIFLIQILLVTFNISYLYELDSVEEFSTSEENVIKQHINKTCNLEDYKISFDDKKIVCEIKNTSKDKQKLNFSYDYWLDFNVSLKQDEKLDNMYKIFVSDINGTLHRRVYNYSYLFDISSREYKWQLKSVEPTRELKDVFDQHNVSLSNNSNPTIYEIDEKNWVMCTKKEECYKIEDVGKVLRVYKQINIKDSVIANISVKITDIKNLENPCIFEIYKGNCKKIKEPATCNLNIKSVGDINGSFINYKGTIILSDKSCKYLSAQVDLQGTNLGVYDKNQAFDMKYVGFSYLPTQVLCQLSNANVNKTQTLNKNLSMQFDIKGYEHKDLWFHWTLFFLTILSFAATLLKLKKYRASEKNINPDLVGFIFSIIADFHYVPAVFMLITLSSLVIGEIKLLVVGALIANFMSLIIIIYELIIKKKE